MPHARDLPPYVAMTPSNQGDPSSLIWDLVPRPMWCGGDELAEDANAMGHGADLRRWWWWGGDCGAKGQQMSGKCP
jgi:hypothetical protein